MATPCLSRTLRRAAGLLALVAAAAGVAAAGDIPWTTEIKKAMASSKSTGRPVFADFWAVWCVPCKAMADTTYRDPQVVAAMDGFVPLRVDQDVQTVFSERCAVEALPTALFLDGDGREIGRLSGLVAADALVARMRAVREGYAAYLEALQSPGDPAALQSVGAYLLEMGQAQGASDVLRQAVKRLADAPPERREPVALLLARAQLEAGDLGPAAAAFEKLSEGAADPRVRGQALAGLIRVRRAKGQNAEAERLMQQLRENYPDLAQQAPGAR